MHRSMNSTQVLSKTYSRVKIGDSSIHQGSPISRPFSSRTKNTTDTILQQSLILKNKKLSIMIKTIHSYMINIQQIDWIMNQIQKIIKNYMKITLDKYGIAHKIQIQNIYSQITKLINRFSGIDKKWMEDMTIPLKQNKKYNNNIIHHNNNNNNYNNNRNIQNINLMNFKKTQTIGSFKCTDTQNQQDTIHLHTDFSKIKLPSIIKQNTIQQNIQSSRFQHQTIIKQYQSAIQVLKKQIQQQKKYKNQIKINLQQKITNLNKKIQLCHIQWQTYKIYAGNCIKKCKYYLNQYITHHNGNMGNMGGIDNNIDGNIENNKIQNILDQLFSLQCKLDRKIVQGSIQDVEIRKQQKIKQLVDIQGQLKNKKDQLDRIQTQRLKLYNNNGSMNMNMNNNNKNYNEQSELVKMLYVQATTIQHLI